MGICGPLMKLTKTVLFLPFWVDHIMKDQNMLKVNENLSQIQFKYKKISRSTQRTTWVTLSITLPAGSSNDFIKVSSKIKEGI